MADALTLDVHPLATETASGSSAWFDVGTRSVARLSVRVGNFASADPTATLQVQVYTAPTDDFSAARLVSQIDGLVTGSRVTLTVTGLERYVAISWDFLPDPANKSAQLLIAGVAHQLFAEPVDVRRFALGADVLDQLTDEQLADYLLRATTDAESAINSAFALPLAGWGDDLRGHVAARAAYYAIQARGYAPGRDADEAILLAGGFRTPGNVKSAAQSFFDAIAAGELKPVGLVDATPDVYEAADAVVDSADLRGW